MEVALRFTRAPWTPSNSFGRCRRMSYGHQEQAAAEVLRQLLTAGAPTPGAMERAQLVSVRDQLRASQESSLRISVGEFSIATQVATEGPVKTLHKILGLPPAGSGTDVEGSGPATRVPHRRRLDDSMANARNAS